MEAGCRIKLLGELLVEQGDRLITRFRTQKTGALLGYLAYHLDRPHPREVLAELLWPWASPRAGRESLRTAIASLRRQLEPPGVPEGALLKADRFAVQLNPETVATDVAEFESALQAAERATNETDRIHHLTQATSLYRGPLLPGYYQDWIPPEQERLAERYFQAVRHLTGALEQTGEVEQALDLARRAVGVDPVREEAHRELMRLLIVARQPETALRQYHELERILKEELGEKPSADIRRLAARLVAVKDRELPVRAEPTTPATPARTRFHRRWPTGTVTFLLTDIEGSTRLREEAGEAFDQALTAHHTLLRKSFRQHGGHEVKELGDGFVAVFEHATDALECAVRSQGGLARRRWPKAVGRLRVRMALHTGEVELVEGEYRGLALHHASRVLTAGHGGQVLCSEGSAVLLRRDLEAGLRLVDLGVYQLRDVQAPERLFQVSYPQMEPREFPPLKADAGYGSHLPLAFTRFFGREDELAWLQETLLREHTRVVTMTGPGGSGKTRLALEAARQLLEPFRGAVWFVPLQELTDARLIPGAIAGALHLPRSPHLEPLDQAVTALSRQPSLLILDNFEHLVEEGAPVVRTLLERAPTLTCLVTSRQCLNLSGEAEFFVAPLPTPGRDETPEVLAQCESVQLLVDRAQAARPDFQVTPANTRVVAELCERLEGIPLAIELAAARAQVLTPAQMLAQLGHRFEFLVSRKRDVPDRHRTLRAALDWSYQALEPELQRFFRQLSVFRGGWTVEAAEAVCEEPHALEYLERLHECSLVLLVETADEAGEMRFRLLETLREYGQKQLAEAREGQAVADRHLCFLVELAERSRETLFGSQRLSWMRRLDLEQDNMRAALHWASEQDPKTGLRLASALGQYWYWCDLPREGDEWLRAMLCAAADAPPGLRGAGLVAGSQLSFRVGNYAAMRGLAEEALPLLRSTGNTGPLGTALGLLGVAALATGDLERATTMFQEALSAFEAAHDPGGVAYVMCELGECATQGGDHARADRLFAESAARLRRLGDTVRRAMALERLGRTAYFRGDQVTALARLEECVQLGRTHRTGLSLAWPIDCLADVLLALGETDRAETLFAESLAMCRDAMNQDLAVYGLRGLGKTAWTHGRPGRLARLFGAAEALHEEVGRARKDTRIDAADEPFVSAARAALGESAFAAAWAEGRAMTLGEAIAYAIGEGEN